MEGTSKKTITKCQEFFKILTLTGLILESRGIGAIFQKKEGKILKNGKIFENLNKNV